MDDRPENLTVLELTLGGLQQNLVKAGSGKEALKCLLEQDFALIILDVLMPELDGFETAKLIRSRDKTRHVPIIFLTAADVSLTTVRKAYASGGVDFLSKPFAPEVLQAKVRVYLELRSITVRLEAEIAERRQGEEKLALYAKELERSNRALGDFAAVLSHDLREPLKKLTALGELLKFRREGALGAEGVDILARMRTTAAGMEALIDGVLALAKVDQGERCLEPVDLNATVAEVLADLEPRVRESQGRVDVGELPNLRADRIQMRQLFQNLLSNALKFRKLEEPACVKIRSRRSGAGLWEITVDDQGVGFDEKYLPRLFKPFERLHGRSRFEGTGVGLAICRAIVQRHGGEIGARSRIGDGTRFTVTLPAESV